MLKSLKSWFLYKLIRVLDQYYERLQSPWWKPNFCEPTVQIVLRDLCRPGDVVFDVGANYGHLSVIMSRLVGPRGVICAFEASPRNLEPLQSNLNRNGCGNVRVVHAAVGAHSGALVGFKYGDHPGADRLGNQEDKSPPDVMVRELALDDFIDHFQMCPRVVKMDIEGAELLALSGFRRTIDSSRPILILESAAGHREAVGLLRSLDYRILDLSNYRELQSDDDFPVGVEVSNVLCFPKEAPPDGYQGSFQTTVVSTLESSDFQVDGNRSWKSKVPLELNEGRYLFKVQIQGTGEQNQLSCGLRELGVPVVKYEGASGWIRNSYSDWIWHCYHPSKLELFFQFVNGTDDPTFQIQKVTISRVENLNLNWMVTI